MTKKTSYRFFVFLAAFFLASNTFSQIRINEIQSVNGTVISDEDGDYEDWIEIVNNSTTQDINLQDYYLSDDNNYMKWKFPSYVLKKKTGSEFERILVFASGKNRYEMTDHWELIINNTDTWKYYTTSTNSLPLNWYNNIYSNWATGSGVFGYGDNNITGPSIPNGTIAIFLQKQFTIADTSLIDEWVFSCDYDDGFVAYINGVEIARDNLGAVGTQVASNALATNAIDAQLTSTNGKPRSYRIPKSVWKNFVKLGANANLLSFEVHNASSSSSDLNATAFLSISLKTSTSSYVPVPNWFPYKPKYFHTNFKIEGSGETISLYKQGVGAQALTVPAMNYNTSYGLRADNGSGGDGVGPFFRFLYPATPKATNNTSSIYSGYTEKPAITTNSGFYNSPITVAITTQNTNNIHIRYTTNGSTPQLSDKLYTVPISIDSTMVLKARVFSNNNSLFPGPVTTASYFINCPTILPIISLTIDSFDLYDWNTGIYVEGPNAATLYPHKGANYWQDWERPCLVEFFDTNRVRQILTEGMIGTFGNYTRAKPQKSWDFKVRTLYDTAGVDYRMFNEKTKTNFKNLVFRNAGSDWMDAHLRDEFLHRVHYGDGIFATPARTVVLYLNGKYHGVYHVREKSDEKFLSDYSGLDKDSIDQIKVAGSEIAANGTLDAFTSMVNFIANSDLTNLNNYNQAKSYWDMDNYMTYFASEIYCANEDWISTWINNIKLWSPRGVMGAKWSYQLHDVDQGLRAAMINDTTLRSAYKTGAANYHTKMLYKFTRNDEFKRRFINKFYDLFNTTLKRDSMLNVLNRFVNTFNVELPRAVAVFPQDPGMNNSMSDNSVTKFNNNINEIKSFIYSRQNVIKNQLISEFGLNGSDTANITIGVAPASIGKGKVKLNSLKPTDQYWSGTYLKSNPIEIEAIAEPGYVFHYWSPSLSFVADSNNMVMIKSVSSGDMLIANFKEAPKIAITELNYKSDPTRNSADWIELYNNSPVAMNLSGWKIKKTSDYKSYTIPNNTILNSGAYLVLVSDTNIFRTQFQGISNKKGPTFLNFNDDGDVLLLTDNKDNVMLRFAYSDTNSWPDCAKGLGRTLQIVDPGLNPSKGTSWTCGCMGGTPGWAYTTPCPEKIIFNEINYNSLQTTNVGDWVELYNRTWDTLNLSGWIFKDGLDDHAFVFPQNTKINPYGYLVLFQNLTQFNSKFGGYTHIKKLGPFTWGLNGDKEAIRLYDNTGKIYQSMYYKDSNPWVDSANGLGYTMELLNPDYNPCNPYSWTFGCKYGSPGSAMVFPCSAYAVEEYEKDQQILIYPNPANENVFVKIKPEFNENAEIQIFDLQGRLVISEKLTNDEVHNISIAYLQKGMYLFKVTNSKTIIWTGKLLKQ